MGLLKDAFNLLVPPIDENYDKQYGWRLRVAIVSCFSFSVYGAILLIDHGILGSMYPFFGSGMARERELLAISAQMAAETSALNLKLDQNVKALDSKLDENHADTISAQLVQLRASHCLAKNSAKQQQWLLINKLMDRYQQLTGRPYVLAACNDL